MKFLTNLLASSFQSSVTSLSGIANNIGSIIQGIVSPVLIVIGAAGVIYAIILGINYIKAETPDKRKEAQSRLIGAIIGVVIVIAGIVICNAVDWGSLVGSDGSSNLFS